MSAPFKPGDIVIGQNFIEETEYNGMEAIIIEGPKKFDCWSNENPWGGEILFGYMVEWSNGDMSVQSQFQLRKKDLPSVLSTLNLKEEMTA